MKKKIRQEYLFPIKGDNRGSLVSIEAERDIPFKVKRVYYIYETKKHAIRGFHAHKSLQQVLVCVNGSCTLIIDDGKKRDEVILNQPNIGLYIGPKIWHEMKDFSIDAVLLVLASEWYREDDYIRNYNEFLLYLKEDRQE